MKQFYSKLMELVPLKYESGNLSDVLSKTLERYISLLESNKKNLGPDKDEIINYVQECNNKINKCIESYFEGMYCEAYNLIKNILDKYPFLNYSKINKEQVVYRARIFDTNKKPSYKDMFHIPLNKKGIVKTQRYSAPGYPCLYLGSSINDCWEELGRPKFDDMMVSRFVTKEDFSVLDLRIPTEIDFNKNLSSILKKIPMIISSSICVLNREDPFKPEYIVPQLITEYIITNNRNNYRKEEYTFFDFKLGILYTSTHIDNSFPHAKNIFNNLALPIVFVNDENNYCQFLASCFQWTNPTSYSYENTKREFKDSYIHIPYLLNKGKLEKSYNFSKMFKLEKRISSLKMNYLDFLIIEKSEITLDSQGDPIKLKIRSSDKLIIKQNFEKSKTYNSMDELLQNIVRQYGKDIYKKGQLLSNIIANLYIEEKKLKKIYRQVITEESISLHVYEISKKPKSEQTTEYDLLAQKIAENNFWSKDFGKQLVESFKKGIEIQQS